MTPGGGGELPHTLTVADGSVRTVSTTTTVRLAERVLAASCVARENLPKGFHTPTPLSLLLEMYVAEESARYLRISELGVTDGMHPRIAERWVAALVTEGLACVRIDHAALTSEGHQTVTRLLQELFTVQRTLDQ
jgi:hypothetical protein